MQLGLLLILFAVVVYLPSWKGEFLWDDNTSVTQSEIVHDDAGWWKAWVAPPPSHPDYFPLTTDSYWCEWRLWGDNPAGYRITNILLHALCALLLWRLFLAMGLAGAWWGALIFAVHPVNVESVAWIAERKNLLSMALAIPSFMAFIRWLESGGCRWYRLSIALFFLSLCAKASVVALPLVFLAYIWWKNSQPPEADKIKALSPFLLLSVVFGIVVVQFQHTRSVGGWEIAMPGMTARLAGAAHAYWFYLGKALWPVGLATIYPRWTLEPVPTPQWLLLCGTAVMIPALWTLKQAWCRSLAFGLTAYALLLAPALGIVQMSFMRYSLVADHFQHLALPAAIALVVCGAAQLCANAWGSLRSFSRAAGLTAALLFCLSWTRAGLHASHEALWLDALSKNPLTPQPHVVLGSILAGRRNFPEAEKHFRQANELNPGDPVTLTNLGFVCSDQGRPKEAVAWFREAIRRNPHQSLPYVKFAGYQAQTGDDEGALETLRAGAGACPGDISVISSAASAYAAAGHPKEALFYLEQWEHLAPGDASIKSNMACVLTQLGRPADAAKKMEEARTIDPSLRAGP
jgi:Flp pilus assembly protein TadD